MKLYTIGMKIVGSIQEEIINKPNAAKPQTCLIPASAAFDLCPDTHSHFNRICLRRKQTYLHLRLTIPSSLLMSQFLSSCEVQP